MVEYAGGDGSSKENAVIIKGAKSSMEGIGAEYRYLSEKFGERGKDWELILQSLIEDKGKRYDMMIVDLKDGTNTTIYFDISGFFGTM